MPTRNIVLGRHVEYVGKLSAERLAEDGPPIPEPERLPSHAQYGGLARPILPGYHGDELSEPNLKVMNSTKPRDFNPLDAERFGTLRFSRHASAPASLIQPLLHRLFSHFAARCESVAHQRMFSPGLKPTTSLSAFTHINEQHANR